MLPVAQLREVSEQAVLHLVGELGKLRGWLGLPLPTDLRRKLIADQARAEHDLAELLACWVAGGGGVQLTPPGSDSDESPLIVPVEVAPEARSEEHEDADPADPDLGVGGTFSASQGVSPAEGSGDASLPGEDFSTPPTDEVGHAPEAGAGGEVADAPELQDPTPTSATVGSAPVIEILAPVAAPVIDVPTPVVASVVPPKPAPASADSLKKLLDLGRSTSAPSLPAGPDPYAVAQGVIALTVTPSLDAVRGAIAARDRWTVLPKSEQVLLLELMAAWVRAFQDESFVPDAGSLMGRLTEFSRNNQPGLALGLDRKHIPRNGSWRADSRVHFETLVVWAGPAAPTLNPERSLGALRTALGILEGVPEDEDDAEASTAVRSAILTCYASGLPKASPQLINLLGEHPAVLEGPDFKKLRQAIRKAEQTEQDEESKTKLPANWPHFIHTRGKRGMLVGGDPRQPQWDILKDAFGFSELQWVTTEFKAVGLQSARASITAGGIDIVLALHRWCGHNVDQILQPACKTRGVLFVPVQRSYGIAGIKDALERFTPK